MDGETAGSAEYRSEEEEPSKDSSSGLFPETGRVRTAEYEEEEEQERIYIDEQAGAALTSKVEAYPEEGGPALSLTRGIDVLLLEQEEHPEAEAVAAPASTLVTQTSKGPPDTGVTAQVVLITTSLGSVRRQFFGSRKAQNFLDCKGIPFYVIDANRDVAKGAGLQDVELLDEWVAHGLLAKDSTAVHARFYVPQIVIDGVTIGRETDLQDLEEDGDLDWILARAECPACLGDRDPLAADCPHCHVQFLELIPDHLVYERRVQRYCRGLPYIDELPPAIERSHQAYNDIVQAAAREPLPGVGATTYEALFGEPPPPTTEEVE